MTIKLFFLACFFTAFVGFAQDDDAYKAFIKRSSVNIHKAQKEMIRANRDEIGGLLAKAIILQNNALVLYKAGNNTRAICTSKLARKCASDIINELNKKESKPYLKEDEKALLTHCADDNELYNESKHITNNPSEDDKDYIKSFNNLSVDFKD